MVDKTTCAVVLKPNKTSSLLVQSNLFITDIKGTGISVRIIEVSILER